MNAPANSNHPRITPSRIPSNLNNFHTLQNGPSHNQLIPDNLFTLCKNIGVYPQKANPQRNLTSQIRKYLPAVARITIEASAQGQSLP